MSNRYKTLASMLLAVGMITSLAACGNAEQGKTSNLENTSKSTMESTQTDKSKNSTDSKTQSEQTEIELAFGDTVMTAVLDDSETSRAFIRMLPLTLTMNRYADREYYAALGELPENGAAIDDFENGDVTYYTDGKSLAIFFGNADMTDFDFSVFNNVEITGINVSELSEEEQAVLYQQARYCQAMTEADTETMMEITSPDMIFTHMSGRQQTRDEYFADIEDGNLQYFTIDIENPVVNISDNYASVSYTSVLNANAYGARGTYRIDGIHWYEKQGEHWIACNAPEQEGGR